MVPDRRAGVWPNEWHDCWPAHLGMYALILGVRVAHCHVPTHYHYHWIEFTPDYSDQGALDQPL